MKKEEEGEAGREEEVSGRGRGGGGEPKTGAGGEGGGLEKGGAKKRDCPALSGEALHQSTSNHKM